MVVFPGSVIVIRGRRESMSSPGRSSGLARFDVFEVDLRAGELYKAGCKIKLQVLPFQALAMLLERPGEVVTRKEFEERLWPGDTFVDFDHSLNTAIKKLRLALGDDKENPRFIETLPKRGYRFIGTVKQPAKQPSSAPQATPPLSPSNTKSAAASISVGRVARVSTEGKPTFVLVSSNEESAAEREKLDAANDDVGLSLLIAAQTVFLVPKGTSVRILEVQDTASRCLVRILEGEHYGKTALVPLKFLPELAS